MEAFPATPPRPVGADRGGTPQLYLFIHHHMGAIVIRESPLISTMSVSLTFLLDPSGIPSSCHGDGGLTLNLSIQSLATLQFTEPHIQEKSDVVDVTGGVDPSLQSCVVGGFGSPESGEG
jgi:hypothetical protein